MTVESGTNKVARLIVADTIKSQDGDNNMLVQTLQALTGPEGGRITQSVMGEYLGTAEPFQIDARVLGLRVINVNAQLLREAMTGLLETYFGLPDTRRPAFLEGLTRLEPIPPQGLIPE